MGQWAKEAAERAIKSAGGAVLLVLGAGRVNVLEVDWATLGGFVGGAVVISLAMSAASFRFGPRGSASVV